MGRALWGLLSRCLSAAQGGPSLRDAFEGESLATAGMDGAVGVWAVEMLAGERQIDLARHG